MSTRTPALLLALLAACTRDAPPPEAPVTGTPPVVTADYTPPPPSEPTPTQPTTSEPPPSEPTTITHAPIASGPPAALLLLGQVDDEATLYAILTTENANRAA